MASDSNSSLITVSDSSNHQNPNPVEVTDRLKSLALSESSENGIVDEVVANFIEVPNGSLFDDDDDDQGDDEIQADEEEGEIGTDSTQVDAAPPEIVEDVVVVQEISSSGVDNYSEHEIDVRSSPSSSGYVGERGTSSASSVSGIEEIEDGNVDNNGIVEQDNSIGGASDSASWVPSASSASGIEEIEDGNVDNNGIVQQGNSIGGASDSASWVPSASSPSGIQEIEDGNVDNGIVEQDNSIGGASDSASWVPSASSASGIEEIEDGNFDNNGIVQQGNSIGGASDSASWVPSASSPSGIQEIEDGNVDNGIVEQDNSIGGASDSASWVPGKRHVDEDDASVSWRKRKKHFFVLSNSGKPIYSRYGDEHKLAGFSATLQAIISFVENGGDSVKFVRAGKHQVVFLVKGPIYLVCISCTDEPHEALRIQLELIYGQMLLILTKSINRCFEKNPKFDMTPLLGGTDAVFSSLIHAFSWNPATFLHAYSCLPLAYPTRQAAGAILQDVAESGVMFAILMCKHKVISLVGAQKASLHPDDMLLLANFVLSSESFRTSESFSPICLPRYNPMAFLYAYVRYLDVDTYLILLTTSSDAFYHLKDCRLRIESVLVKSNVLSEVQRSILDGGLRVEDLPTDPSLRSPPLSPHLGQDRVTAESHDRFKEADIGIGGPAGLWHFIYRSIYLDQYVSSEFSSPINNSKQQKGLYRAYQRVYASMHDKASGPHKTQFRRDENYVILCWTTQDFELYAAFDPLADKALAIKTCNRVCQWVRDLENEIFLLGASPFSW